MNDPITFVLIKARAQGNTNIKNMFITSNPFSTKNWTKNTFLTTAQTVSSNFRVEFFFWAMVMWALIWFNDFLVLSNPGYNVQMTLVPCWLLESSFTVLILSLCFHTFFLLKISHNIIAPISELWILPSNLAGGKPFLAFKKFQISVGVRCNDSNEWITKLQFVISQIELFQQSQVFRNLIKSPSYEL